MESASPFHNLIPYKYVKLRYSPLIATFVEPDVENLFNQCNITFNDLFAVLGSTQVMPVRIVPHYTVTDESQDTYFGKVFNDCTLFSQSFIMPEYEKDDTTVPQLSPTPDRFPSKFHYPSPEASKPLWYVLMLENLLKSCQYANLDFTDLPCCIIYATLNSSTIPIKKADEIKKLLQFPAWMKEFIADIPIIRIVVYDGLVQKTPVEQIPAGSFAQAIPLIIKSRQEDSPSDLDDLYLSNLFKYDEKLLKYPNFCKYLTRADFDSIREVLTTIYNFISNNIETNIKTLELVYKQSKSFFGKSKVERIVQGYPWAKISRLQIAAYYLALQKNEEARKLYKIFVKEIQQNNQLRLYAQFMSSICVVNSSNPQEFRESIIEIMRDINYANSLRFLMMVPLLSVEFHASVNEKGDAYTLMKHAIMKITLFWNGNIPMKSLFLALFNERMAGLCSDRKKSLFLTSRAAYLYKIAGQLPHAIRCYIWLQRGLPNQSWQLLSQTAWYQKASLLCSLTQYDRGFNDWKELLALPNLSESLQDRVVNKFWVPFKENNKSISKVEMNTTMSLLKVKSLEIIDISIPEYWKLDNDEFELMNEAFEKFVSKKIVRSVSFDSWYEDDDLTSKRKKKKIHKVGVGTVVILTLKLVNKFKFPIKLEKCTLKADFHLISKGNEQKYASSEILAVSQSSPLYNSSSPQQAPVSSSSLVPEEENQQQQQPESPQGNETQVNGNENNSNKDSVTTNAPPNEEEDEVFVSENETLHSQNVYLANEVAPAISLKQEIQPSNPIVTMDDEIDDDEVFENDDENYDKLFSSTPFDLPNQNQNETSKESEIKRKNKIMDSFSEKFYKIDQINDTEIPGLSKEPTEVSFKFVPLAEGRYTVSRFEKNYFGLFDTEVACGPLTFIAKNSQPQLSMQIIDFPEKCYSGQCVQFSIKMTNTGTCTIKEICVLFDQNDSIFCLDSLPTNYPEYGISILQMKKLIEPKETFFLKMILWANIPDNNNNNENAAIEVNGNYNFHFCVCANGLKCGFEKKILTINKAVIFDPVVFKKNNDTLNNVFQVTITSLIDGLTVIGLINKNCQFLKTITTNDSKSQILNKGESSSVIALTLDTTDETAENWRSELCDKNSVTVLYKINDDKLNSQINLKLKVKEPKYRLKIYIEQVVKINTRCKCMIKIFKNDDQKKEDDKNIYIMPMKFKFVDFSDEVDENKRNNNSTSTIRARPNISRVPSIKNINRNSINNNNSSNVGIAAASSTGSSGALNSRITSSSTSPSLPNINRNSNRNSLNFGRNQRSPSINSMMSPSNDSLSANDQMCGCNWIGRTTQVFKVADEVDTSFDFVVMRCGVYELPGFFLAFTPDFKNAIPVKASTIFRVIDENVI